MRTMRGSLSFLVAAFVTLVTATGEAAPDASAPDASTGDSGITTMPSPNNPTIPLDSGADGGKGTAPADDGSGGCSVVSSTPSSEGWSTMLGLFTAASVLVLASRRRGTR